MTCYIVFEPPVPTGEMPGPSDRAVLVRDGIVKWAVLFPFLWLFRHGLILAGLVVLAASIGLSLIGAVPGLGLAALVLPLALGVLVALEGPSLRAARYRRRGFREAAVVDAVDEEEAAILYYAGTSTEDGAVPVERAAPVAERLPRARTLLPRGQNLLDPQGYR